MTAKPDVATIVTERLLEALEAGVAPWDRPWKTGGNAPRNAVTGRRYTGVNRLLLEVVEMTSEGGFPTSQWLTYRQAQSAGGSVRKGEKGVPVVLYKTVTKDEGTDDERSYRLLRYFTVFNLAQCDGLEHLQDAPDTTEASDRHADRVDVWTQWADRPPLRWGGDRAYYSWCPKTGVEEIVLPHEDAFDHAADVTAVLLHEAIHATGHPKRLGRFSEDEAVRFGDESYSFEELVAEIGSCILQSEAGIPFNVTRSASYIAGWSKYCAQNRGEILKAAAAASKAAEYIRREAATA